MAILQEKPIDLEQLPGTNEIFGGELHLMWEEALAQVLANVLDMRTPSDTERTITFKVSFQPEADLRSSICALDSVTISKPMVQSPAPCRLVITRGEELSVHQRTQDREGLEEPPAPPRIARGSLPALRDLLDGKIEGAWRDALARVALNLASPRAVVKCKRSISLSVGIKTDPRRTELKYRLKKIATTLAPIDVSESSVLFVEHDSQGQVVLDLEPDRFLPAGTVSEKGGVGDVKRAKQTAITN